MTPAELREHCTREAIRIWREHAGSHSGGPGAALMPLLLEDYHVGAELLFVGMNPSFSPDEVKAILRRVRPEADISRFFAWDSALDGELLVKRIADIVSFETEARVVYDRYFKPLRDFASVAGATSHAHIDMFLMRHTSQKDVKDAYGDTFAKVKRTPFMLQQFDLFVHTLNALQPKVVVVANAGASDFAVDGLSLTSPDGRRSYRWAEMPDVPIFLCGMLSGQRALDSYSRDRLALDVKAALQAVRG